MWRAEVEFPAGALVEAKVCVCVCVCVCVWGRGGLQQFCIVPCLRHTTSLIPLLPWYRKPTLNLPVHTSPPCAQLVWLEASGQAVWEEGSDRRIEVGAYALAKNNF